MDVESIGGAFRFLDCELWCENVRLKTVKESVSEQFDWHGPVFVYSEQQLRSNIGAYVDALREHGLDYVLAYALKANSSYRLLKVIRQQDCFAVTVSGHEMEMAMLAGFPPQRIILNGNGKRIWEIEKGLLNGCLLNVDSGFDADAILAVARKLDVRGGRLLLRINPNLDAKVHPHNCTALARSKFGIELEQLDGIASKLLDNEFVDLVGVHCHVGSTVDDVGIYEDVSRLLLRAAHHLRKQGFGLLKLINIGGGLGIDYSRRNPDFPTAKDLIGRISHLFRAEDFTLVLEPGRSIIGNAGVLMADVIGTKRNGSTNFVVTDASMTEVIRPSLYAAYHHITRLDLTATSAESEKQLFDVVGPVCESGDFLGKDRLLHRPTAGSRLVIWDVGAYCAAMSSNYNLRARAAEVFISEIEELTDRIHVRVVIHEISFRQIYGDLKS